MLKLLRTAISNLIRNEDGPTAVEYAVVLTLIIIACIFSVTALGTNTRKIHTKVSNVLGAAS